MNKRLILIATLFLFAVYAGFASAADPVEKWVSSSQIKPVGETWCDGKMEHQQMAVVATLKDTQGTTSEKEMSKWDQLTGKSCSDASKSRGMAPDKPNAKASMEAAEKVKAEASKPKSRGGCTYQPYYYKYWDYGTYLYVEWYDNCWNFVAYEYRY